jgi:ubiquinone/menaquinone biosynthesis C-methylase UbiE
MGMMRIVLIAVSLSTLLGQSAAQQVFKPEVGQKGKDVVWVPTAPAVVEKMLDLAQVTSDDFVIDLGSGDGRMVIAAAKRGARALGVEFDSNMIQLSRQLAVEAGVADRATFVEGDMFEADISKATVLALFLLPDNLRRLEPKFRALRPGTRIVVNTFGVPDWKPEVTEEITENCASWCTAMLYHVPPRIQ